MISHETMPAGYCNVEANSLLLPTHPPYNSFTRRLRRQITDGFDAGLHEHGESGTNGATYSLSHLLDQIHDIGQARATSGSNAHSQKNFPLVSLASPQLLQVVHSLGTDVDDSFHHLVFNLCDDEIPHNGEMKELVPCLCTQETVNVLVSTEKQGMQMSLVPTEHASGLHAETPQRPSFEFTPPIALMITCTLVKLVSVPAKTDDSTIIFVRPKSCDHETVSFQL